MIDYQQFCQIKQLHDHDGLHVWQIADRLALDPRTVAYWLSQDHYRPRKATARPSKLDPFKADIRAPARQVSLQCRSSLATPT